MLSLFAVPSYAHDVPDPEGMLEDKDLRINDEVAYYIAQFFVDDMFHTGATKWANAPAILDVVAMYDETGKPITAYTVELTEGYVVVSAFVDMPCIILEWADEAAPAYREFAATPIAMNNKDSGQVKILYLGGLDYYLDTGNSTVVDTMGEVVSRDGLYTDFDEFRSTDYVSDSMMD